MTTAINHDQVSGLILAGGAGRRVGGRDKGLLHWRGQALVEHVSSRLAPQVGELLISCNRNLERYEHAGGRLASDLRDDYQGPLAGMEGAAALIDTPWVVVVACDLPLLPQDLVARLGLALMQAPQHLVACAHDGEQPQFLCALMHRDCLKTLPDYLDKGGRSVGGWYRTQGLLEVDYSDQHQAFLNLNKLPPEHEA